MRVSELLGGSVLDLREDEGGEGGSIGRSGAGLRVFGQNGGAVGYAGAGYLRQQASVAVKMVGDRDGRTIREGSVLEERRLLR